MIPIGEVLLFSIVCKHCSINIPISHQTKQPKVNHSKYPIKIAPASTKINADQALSFFCFGANFLIHFGVHLLKLLDIY
jgi:hypothetical protein